MSDNNSFLNIVRGTRLTNYMGIQQHAKPGEHFVYAPDYTYIQLPIYHMMLDSGKEVSENTEKALRNQYVLIIPNLSVNCRGGYKILVEPNPELYQFGICQASYYIHSGSGEKTPSFYIQLRKDLDLEKHPELYAVRLYLRT